MNIDDDLEKEFFYEGYEVLHEFPIPDTSDLLSLMYNETQNIWYIEGIIPETGEDFFDELPEDVLTEDICTEHCCIKKEFLIQCKKLVEDNKNIKR